MRSGSDEFGSALARHAGRRLTGRPTVSTLVGPASAVGRLWANGHGGTGVTVGVSDPAVLPARVVAHLRAAVDLPGLAADHLRASAGLPPGARASAAMTVFDADRLAAAALARVADPSGTVAVARAVLTGTASGTGDAAFAMLDAAVADRPGPPAWRSVRALDGLLPAAARPAVLWVAGPAAADDWPAAVVGAVAAMAEAVPGWPVGVGCSAAAFDRYCRTAPPSRAKSMVVAGEARVPVPDGAAVRERLRDVPDADRPPAVAVLTAAVAATGPVADAFAEAARLRPDRDDAARSAAERLLFDLLDSHPATAGQFALNADPGFRFGTRAAEVDLLAAGLRLAVEVDGYHHFADEDRYRRDRRKDWALQAHGYAVLRVLADDVVGRTAEVLDTVVAAADHCRRQLDPGRPRT